MTRTATARQADTQALEKMIRRCVHCGFCNATCPSYQELGNELDGPRGRIYQIANMVSGESDDISVRKHLDTCLQCRNCETTCPSSVEYSRIFALGRELAVEKYPYSFKIRMQQKLLVALFNKISVTKALFSIAALFRPCMPAAIRRAIPKRSKRMPLVDTSGCNKTVLLIQGCVQSAAYPDTNTALHNLCARLGIRLVFVNPATCCSALAHHNNQPQQATARARANIDSCWSHIEQGVDGIVMAASACVLELREYPQLLRDHAYSQKARVFADLVRDPSDLLSDLASLELDVKEYGQTSLAFHPPCTLQHGQGKSGRVEQLLADCGFQLQPIEKKNLCCGSAGSYSIFQPKVAKALRREKLTNLCAHKPDYLATANIGCQMFLQQATDQQVWHWVELVEYFANQKNPLY